VGKSAKIIVATGFNGCPKCKNRPIWSHCKGNKSDNVYYEFNFICLHYSTYDLFRIGLGGVALVLSVAILG